MTMLTKRLDKHFATCAAAAAGAAAIGSAQNAEAAIFYSGTVNISIGGDFAGVYLNVITGLTTTTSGLNIGYDINPYYGGNKMFTPGADDLVGVGTAASNLPAGTIIDGASSFITSTSFPTMGAFTAGQPGYLGLRFLRESDSALLFGWVRMTKSSANNLPGTIVDYAYETTGGGIAAGDTGIPAPASLSLLALGIAGLRGRRRAA